MEWLSHSVAEVSLALATAAGSLAIVSLNEDTGLECKTDKCCFEEAMAASVAISRTGEKASLQLGSSGSNGELAILQVRLIMKLLPVALTCDQFSC